MALFNSGYPATYQPPVFFPQYQQPQQQQNNGSLIWVQGEAGAKSYLVAPNTTVQLWDSESQTIYLKSADASGMPSIKVLDYTIRNQSTAAAPPITQDTYATKAEIESINQQIGALRRDVDAMTRKGDSANA